jgi:hypothetical protein
MTQQAKTDDRKRMLAWQAAKLLTKLVLQAVDDGMLFFEGTYRYPRVAVHQGLEGLRRVVREEERRRVAQRFRDLKRRGLLEERRRAGRIGWLLTGKGKAALLRLKIALAPRRDDAQRLLVIFDIPENRRGAREALRELLRSSGFVRLQRSVWITDRDAWPILAEWARKEHLTDWIRAFRVVEA